MCSSQASSTDVRAARSSLLTSGVNGSWARRRSTCRRARTAVSQIRMASMGTSLVAMALISSGKRALPERSRPVQVEQAPCRPMGTRRRSYSRRPTRPRPLGVGAAHRDHTKRGVACRHAWHPFPNTHRAAGVGAWSRGLQSRRRPSTDPFPSPRRAFAIPGPHAGAPRSDRLVEEVGGRGKSRTPTGASVATPGRPHAGR